MRFIMCLLLLTSTVLVSMPMKDASAKQIVRKDGKFLVRDISLEGFVLKDRTALEAVIKTYKNKYLSQDQLDAMQQEIEDIYQEAGYQGLVDISVKLTNNRFVVKIILRDI